MNPTTSYDAYCLKAKRRETANVNTLIFDHILHRAEPGQFVMLWLPGIGEKPFCVANVAPFSITVANAGEFSALVHQMRIGDRVWIRGPYGHGFKLRGQKHLLVGGGYGAAPLLFLAKLALKRGHAVQVCLGARSAEDILLADAFHHAGCTVMVATQDGSRGLQGLVTHAAEQALRDFQPDTLYACGPLPMLSALALICRKKTVPAQLSYEALMRCGIGLCGSCELDGQTRAAAAIPPGWLTCKDGPVFLVNAEPEI